MANTKKVLYVKPKATKSDSDTSNENSSMKNSTPTAKKNHTDTEVPTSNFMTESTISDETLRKIVNPRDKQEFNQKIDDFLKETEEEEQRNAEDEKPSAPIQVDAIADIPADVESSNSTQATIGDNEPTNVSNVPVEKRKPGRKPKIKDAEPAAETTNEPKRQGRTANPDKLAEIQAAVNAELGEMPTEKRKPGRPKAIKSVTEVNSEAPKVKGKPGRKPKAQEPATQVLASENPVEETAKRKPGRPKSTPTAEVEAKPKGKPGRKPKMQVTEAESTTTENSVEETTKRKPGRPKATPTAEVEAKPKGKPGRKPKAKAEGETPIAEVPKRKAGRPKKEKLAVAKVALQEQVDDESPIQKTTEYDRFKFSEENRDLDLKHVEELIKSITEKNLLSSNPIIVNSKMEIMDGQHRYEAAKFLETPLYFKEDNNFKPNDIARINTVNRKWQLEDYLKHFRSQGNGQYAALDNFINQYNVNIYSAIGLLSGRTAQPNNELISKFKDGKFAVKDFEHAIHVLTVRNSFADYSTDFYKSKMFLNVVSKLVKDPEYDHQKMIAQIQNQSRSFVKCNTVMQYLEMMTELFNYNFRKGQRVDFTKDATID